MLLPAGTVRAQAGGDDPCLRPDSVVVRGLRRVTAAEAVSQTGLVRGQELSVPVVQRAVKALYESGHFSNVAVTCEVLSGSSARRVFALVEHPILAFQNRRPAC